MPRRQRRKSRDPGSGRREAPVRAEAEHHDQPARAKVRSHARRPPHLAALVQAGQRKRDSGAIQRAAVSEDVSVGARQGGAVRGPVPRMRDLFVAIMTNQKQHDRACRLIKETYARVLLPTHFVFYSDASDSSL